MLTYQDVVTVRLGPLTTAAAAWDRMADGFRDLGEVYGTHVQGVATGGVWVGVSADAAASRFTVSRQQFDAAVV
ncbi:PPE domain-containing protein [Streptomyces cyaneofuscatus]